jgi:hypothetical protein
MIRVGEPVRTRIRNAMALLLAVCVFGLLFVKPFLPAWWQANASDLICMMVVIGFAVVLLFNKLVCGVFFPGPPKDARGHPKP